MSDVPLILTIGQVASFIAGFTLVVYIVVRLHKHENLRIKMGIGEKLFAAAMGVIGGSVGSALFGFATIHPQAALLVSLSLLACWFILGRIIKALDA